MLPHVMTVVPVWWPFHQTYQYHLIWHQYLPHKTTPLEKCKSLHASFGDSGKFSEVKFRQDGKILNCPWVHPPQLLLTLLNVLKWLRRLTHEEAFRCLNKIHDFDPERTVKLSHQWVKFAALAFLCCCVSVGELRGSNKTVLRYLWVRSGDH